MGHTDRTDQGVGLSVVRIVLTATKHFTFSGEFGVDFQTNCWCIGFHDVYITPLVNVEQGYPAILSALPLFQQILQTHAF